MYPPSAHINCSLQNVRLNGSNTIFAPSRSWIAAECTTTKSKPSVSTRICRFRPFPCFSASYPRIPFFRGLDRLIVKYARTGLTRTTHTFTKVGTKPVTNPLPGFIFFPQSEVVVEDTSPLGQIVRDGTPGTTGMQNIPVPIQQFVSRIFLRTSARFDPRNQWLQHVPLGIP